jgi:hypothetical protein
MSHKHNNPNANINHYFQRNESNQNHHLLMNYLKRKYLYFNKFCFDYLRSNVIGLTQRTH